MWGGRFAEGPSAVMREINASIPFDKRLWQQDIAGSKAHVAMLGKAKIVTEADAAAISGGLDQVAAEYAEQGVPVDELQRYIPSVSGVSPAAVQRVAASLMDPSRGAVYATSWPLADETP